MYDILFICAANVGRSQMAEGWYNYYSQGYNARSAAGIQDVGLKYNFRPHPLITEIMQERGVDISNHRVKMLEKSLIDDTRKIILFCEPEFIRPDLSNLLVDHKNKQYIPIEDPYPEGNLNREEELKKKFMYTRDKIEEVIREILHVP